MHSSLVRQCLQQLGDDELEDLLASSASLREGVRWAANQRKGVRVDARMFRRWVSMPAASDQLLQELPRRYAGEVRRRRAEGEHLERTVGVRAMLLLDSYAMTLERFKVALGKLRTDPESEFDAVIESAADIATTGVGAAARSATTSRAGDGAESGGGAEVGEMAGLREMAELVDGTEEFDIAHIVTSLGSGELGELIDGLRAESAELAAILSAAADDARAGRSVPDLREPLVAWNRAVRDGWRALGLGGAPASAGFDALDEVRAHLADREREAALLLEQRQFEQRDRRERLAKLRELVEKLAPLSGEEQFRRSYEHALAEITELERALESAGIAGDGDGDVRDGIVLETDRHATDAVPAVESGLTERSTLVSDLPLTATDVDADSAPAPDLDGESGDVEGSRVGVSGEGEAGSDSVEGGTTVESVDSRPSSPPTTGSASREPQHSSSPQHLSGEQLFSGEEHTRTPAKAPEEVSARGDATVVHRHPVAASVLRPAGPSSLTDEMTRHVRAGRFGAACLVAQAAGLPELDIRAYRLAAAAFHSAPGGIDPAEVLIELTTMPEGQEYAGPQAAKVALAAALRAGLTAGWIPRSELEAIVRQANLGSAWRDLVDAAIGAGDRNYQHLRDFGGRSELSIDDVHERARTVLVELEGQRIKFARADKVLKYLLRKQEPLGAALEAILAPSTGEERREALTDALAKLESPDQLISATDATVSAAQQLRHPIVSHARVRLRRAIESVTECVNEALNSAVMTAGDSRAAVDQEARRNLVVAARAVDAEGEAAGPGDVAMGCLVGWIIEPDTPTRVADVLQVLIDESLPVTCTARDERGLPIIEPGKGARVVEELRDPRSAQELFDIFVARGDLQEAAAVARQEPDLRARLASERSSLARRLRREVDAVRAELGRTYADDLTLGAHADAEARLITPAEYTGDRYDLQMRDLSLLTREFAEHRARAAGVLRQRVGEEVTEGRDRDRITALIDEEDFVGANELLALARSGALPATGGDDNPFGAHVFTAFTEALSALNMSAASSVQDIVAQFGGGREGSAATVEHGDLTRLGHWNNLIQKGQGGRSHRHATLGSILRALGLDTQGEVARQPSPGARHFDRYRVTATPLDGSLVPGLGSRTTHYMVVATANQQLLRETLSKGFPTKNGPNIVLFDGVLTLEQRRQCLITCREQKISAIVVDHAVAAFVATWYPRSFRAVQQITLPFTCFTHYTVIAGNVPDEVFVGRADELATLTDRAGSLFVYGGRQLGKSALLRKIQRSFSAEPDHHAIFIDLNSHGIGTWADSQKLWPVLYNELAKIETMGLKPNQAVRTPDPVTKAVRQWLAGKESRRLLLLLDEADAFLEKESSGSSHAFENIGPLKGMFDDTEGRFKPVFAGLHKVQRLQNVANTPLAHGGRDILIGPLAAKPAHDLVVEPLAALGYRFENPEAVWRLLAFTNLQAGLIQVVCHDLITHLQSRPPHKGEPLITIRDADIDHVTQDPRTRARIAEKLRLTIALEDRYRVIALAVAIMCMEDAFLEKYTAADIREHCEVYWQQGFEDLNSTEFADYLDELVGLGVLIKDSDARFSVRSPNIVTMLGTKEQLETELDENGEQFELPHEYNARSTRRQVSIDNKPVRSPLSEHDLSRLIPVKAKYEPARNFVIAGSAALGIDAVARVLKSVGEERRADVTVVDPGAEDIELVLSSFRFAGSGHSAPRLLVVDAARAPRHEAVEIAAAVRSMKKRQAGHLVVVYGASGLAAARELFEVPSVVQTEPIDLGKWSGDGIRSWHDIPFNTPGDRRELLTHSGGWPELVERAVADVSNGSTSHAEEWARLSNFPENKADAIRFLHSVGVDDRARAVLTDWAELGSTGYERIADIAAVLDRDPAQVRDIAVDLTALGVLDEQLDEYAIDPVVARAARELS